MPAESLTVFDTGQPRISNLFLGRVSGLMVFNFGAPVMRDGKVKFVMLVTMELPRLQELLNAQEIPKAWHTVLRDGLGVVLAAAGASGDLVMELKLTAEAVSTDRFGVFREQDRSGEERLCAVVKYRLSGWTISAWIETSVIDAPWRRSWGLLAVAVGSLITLSAALASLFGRSLSRPNLLAERASRQLGEAASPSSGFRHCARPTPLSPQWSRLPR